jgi:hypothetical protein
VRDWAPNNATLPCMPTVIHSPCFVVAYWLVALVGSTLNTIFAPTIHNLHITIRKWPYGPDENKAVRWNDMPWASRISQWVLNFFGSMVGWSALAYILYLRLSPPVSLGFADLIVLIVAFYGVTGYLPYILIQKGFPWK